ncbi:MAG: acetylornithine deacetylase [Deltaproteobacteria bacterium]
MDIVETLQALVAIDSTSSRSNLPVLDWLEPRVRRLGFETRRMTWPDAVGVEKGNLIARMGPDEPGGLALVGHTDCVPFDPDWGEALSGTVRDGNLFGRGSADTKGSIAAMLLAASRVRPARGPLWLLFTADEEVGCQGAKALAHEGRIRPARAIIGEPTRLVPVRAHKGYCAVDVTVTGIEGHSAFPDVGASAIHAAARLITEIERIQARLAAVHSDATFSPPHTTFNVGIIHGGKARNVLAGDCFFTLEWRPIPGQEPVLGLDRVDAASRALEQASGGKITVSRTPMRVDPAGVTPADAEVVRFLETESGNGSVAIPFGTELPELIHLGAEACVFGPGDIRVAHRTGEFVPLDEVHRAADAYGRAITRFCA